MLYVCVCGTKVSACTYLSKCIVGLTDINACILTVCVRNAQFGDHAIVEHLISYCIAVCVSVCMSVCMSVCVIYMQVNAFKRYKIHTHTRTSACKRWHLARYGYEIRIQIQIQMQTHRYTDTDADADAEIRIRVCATWATQCNFITMFFTLQQLLLLLLCVDKDEDERGQHTHRWQSRAHVYVRK